MSSSLKAVLSPFCSAVSVRIVARFALMCAAYPGQAIGGAGQRRAPELRARRRGRPRPPRRRSRARGRGGGCARCRRPRRCFRPRGEWSKITPATLDSPSTASSRSRAMPPSRAAVSSLRSAAAEGAAGELGRGPRPVGPPQAPAARRRGLPFRAHSRAQAAPRPPRGSGASCPGGRRGGSPPPWRRASRRPARRRPSAPRVVRRALSSGRGSFRSR